MESRDPVTRVTKNSEVSEMSLDRGSRTLDVTCIQRQIPFQLLCKHLPFNVISMNSNAWMISKKEWLHTQILTAIMAIKTSFSLMENQSLIKVIYTVLKIDWVSWIAIFALQHSTFVFGKMLWKMHTKMRTTSVQRLKKINSMSTAGTSRFQFCLGLHKTRLEEQWEIFITSTIPYQTNKKIAFRRGKTQLHPSFYQSQSRFYRIIV